MQRDGPRVVLLCLGVWCWASVGYAQTATSASAPAADAPAVSEADRLAAESFLASALSLMHAEANTPGRGGRMIALSRFADRLRPGDARTKWVLAGIYQAQGRTEPMAEAQGVCFAAERSDHLLGLRWLRLNLDIRHTAEDRVQYLQRFLEHEEYPPALRAEAWAELAATLRGQGWRGKARLAFETAARLDPHNPEALGGALSYVKDPTPADRVRTMLGILRGNPRKAELALQLAGTLAKLGLYERSLEFFEHALEMADLNVDRELQYVFVLPEYCSALLDANQPAKAVEMLEPMLERTESSDLRSLLIEAYQAMGETAKADALIEKTEASLKSKQEQEKMQASLESKKKQAAKPLMFARDLAWFYLLTAPRPAEALKYALSAWKSASDDPVMQRIRGIAELLTTGLDAPGLTRLTPLAKTDAYAALFLARYHFEHDDPNAGAEALMGGIALGRSGPAFRRLAALAAERKLPLPPEPGRDKVADLVDRFDRRYLQMTREPAKFLSIQLKPLKHTVGLNEPIEVQAVLTSTAQVDIPLGDWGLLSPRLSLHAGILGLRGSFQNLPLVVWPAPRYLPPASSLTVTVDLAVGRLQELLATHPLAQYELTVRGTVDPVQRGLGFYSSLPALQVEPVKIVRVPLMPGVDANDSQQLAGTCRVVLGRLVYDIQKGDLPTRMRAARKTASLLAMVRRVDAGRLAPLPAPMAKAFSRPVLLRIVVEVLKDKSDVVRAEMLAALNSVELDDGIVSLLAGAIEDPSALVRFRLAELLGACGLPGQNTIVDYLAQDRHEMVQLMASTFLAPARK